MILGQQPSPPSCDDVDDFTSIASLNDCRLYYQCIGGIAFQLQCPRGNYFSTERQTCVPYAESDCPLLTPPTTPGPPTCDDVPEFGYIPSLDACDYYYQCFGGEQWLLKCPRGTYFSFERQTCVSPSESDCPLIPTTPSPLPTPPTQPPPPPIPTCSDVPEFGYIPSNTSCAQFYQCFANEQWLMQCPRGNYFSFVSQTCVPYAESDCWLLNTPPPPPTGSPPPPPTGTPPTPPQTAPPLPTVPSENSCDEDGNCYEIIENAPIFVERHPRRN